MISFNSIPILIRTPGHFIEFDPSRAQQGLPAMPHRILAIGQRLTTGTVAQKVPTKIVGVTDGETSFGRGSMLALMLKALREVNAYTECYAVALDDNVAGVAATKTLTVTGPATAAGTLRIYVGGVRVEVSVANAAVQNDIATAIAAAITAKTELPVTAAANTNVVTLTARNKGEVGNSLDVRLNYWFGDATPAGIAVAIAAGVSGTGNPDVAEAIAAIADVHYHTVVMPYADASNLTALESELADRWGPMEQKEGHAFAAHYGTLAQGTTLGDSRNSPHLTVLGLQKSPTWAPVAAAIVAAVDAFEPDPARPRQTLWLKGLLPPAETDRYTRAERNTHLYDGVATYQVDAGGRCVIDRLITTYKTNALGAEDISYLDVETMRTLAYLRYSVRNRIALKYPRHKLADDGTRFGPGQAVVTPKVIRAELIALFGEWEAAGLAEDLEQFKADLIVERNATDPNRLDAVIPPDCVNQLRVFAASIQFRL